ncbi:MAG TPA: hypothetical protein VFA79_09440 [Myxococcales bacterium]|nr:hypothetical protein [Myxococcales bacterium]
MRAKPVWILLAINASALYGFWAVSQCNQKLAEMHEHSVTTHPEGSADGP